MNTNTATNHIDAEPIDATPLRFPKREDGVEIAKFLGSAASLWAKQRDRIDELEAAHAAERFRRVEAYQKRMQALANEAADALRHMDREHAAKLIESRRMLAALDALRDS
jgi:hypothetical protein